MALPWPLLGAGLSVLPKPGAWMVRVKQLFGALIFGMALYYGYLGWSLRSGAVDQQEITGNFTAELQEAAAADETVLIDCWATWCKNCAAQERVLQSPEVQNVLQKHNVKVIRFQAENLNDPAVKAFMQKYQLPGLPSMVLLKK
jgi:thiol:disulfide interchange protein